MKRLILVDACNLLHRLPHYKSRLNEGMDSLSRELLNEILPLHDHLDWEIHLVVDGKGNRMQQEFPGPDSSYSLIFTATDDSADSLIETWLMKLDPSWSIRVASEDRAIMHTAIAHHAEPLSADELIAWAVRVRQQFSDSQNRNKGKSSNTFGNRLEGLS